MATAKKATAKKTATKKAATKKAATKKAATKKAAPRKITAKKALANTRRLLEAKHAHDREAPPWQALEAAHGTSPQPGYQSDEARTRAVELHAGESRMDAIEGSVASQGRHNQGRRDKR